MPLELSRRRFGALAGMGVVGAALPAARATTLDAPAPAASPSAPPRPAGAEPGGPLRLHFNENPYGPAPAARQELARLAEIAWQYPSGRSGELREAIAAHHGIAPERVLLGNGSAELLQLAARAYLADDRPLVVADPTYEALEQYARGLGAPVVQVPLDAAWGHDVERMAAVDGAGLLYLCNPNNPTATLTPRAAVRRALERAPGDGAVIVDEAYHHYVLSADYESAVGLDEQHPRLVVLRTFSKIYGLAGLRIGYAVAHPEVVRRLAALQSRNNLNIAALTAARAALADAAWVEEHRVRNAETRAATVAALAERGLSTLPSEASFFMVDLGREVGAVGEAMRAAGVAVGRPFPPLVRHLRVTVGRPEQMKAFLAALDQALAAAAAIGSPGRSPD
ncbi:MAG TPA: aminotransferase class I/II-fold pyridoxal phosphate-dependent enzyme [Thermoanaerobaculia bacterium]|nr:aminotransferase class I/II-fold pyridoxal phosphate-dependent enzyme [Thermoanaerobaculia bacterium]